MNRQYMTEEVSMTMMNEATDRKWAGLPMWVGCCVCRCEVMIDTPSTNVLSGVAADTYGQVLPVAFLMHGQSYQMGHCPFCGQCAELARWFGARRRRLNLAVLRRAFSVYLSEIHAPHELAWLFSGYDREDREYRANQAELPPEVQRSLGSGLFGGEVVEVEWSKPVEVGLWSEGVVHAYDQLLVRYGRSTEERDGVLAQ